MSKLFAPVFALLAMVFAACSAAPPAATPTPVPEAYELASDALGNVWEQVQIDFSLSATSAGDTISIEQGAVQLQLDEPAGKARVSVDLALEDLGIEPATSGPAALIGDRIEFEALFDGEALYARSPLAATFLPLLYMQIGRPVEGDFTGWLKLGTKTEFETLLGLAMAGSGQTLPTPDLSAIASIPPAELEQKLEESGVTLTYVGSETRNGVEAEHLTLAFDPQQLAENPPFPGFDPSRLDQLTESGVTLTGDIWIAKGTGRVSEIALHGSSTEAELENLEFTLLFTELPAGTTFDAPAEFVEVPVVELIGQVSQGGFGQ